MKKMYILLFGVLVMEVAGAQPAGDARKLLDYERYDSATRLLQKLIGSDPNNPEYWWLMTRGCMHTGKAKEIKGRLLQLPAQNFNAPLLLCAYGELLLNESKKDSAAVFFNRALQATRQKDPILLLAVANAQIDIPGGDLNYAVDLLHKAIARDKHDAALYVALGNAYRKLQNGSDSYNAYQEALRQDSHCAGASYRLGQIFASQENPDLYLKYFNDAVRADSFYAPAWYALYYHYYFRDVNLAMDNLRHYIACTGETTRNEYLLTDLLYVSRKYEDAIRKARRLITEQGGGADPRMYKLVAYSYKELNDSVNALDFMRQYFKVQSDTGFVLRDYETMGDIFDKMYHMPDSAAGYYVQAVKMEKDSVQRIGYYAKLATIYEKMKDFPDQAIWLGKYYHESQKSTNLDLFNWGLANYMARNFQMADSVFGMYETKYPEQEFGYYWRARSDAAIDTAMSEGLAIPHYLKLIEVAGSDTANRVTRKHLIEAYGYIAAYDANMKKDLPAAIENFEKLLVLDPENRDAARYVDILKRSLNKTETSKAGSQRGGQNKPDGEN